MSFFFFFFIFFLIFFFYLYIYIFYYYYYYCYYYCYKICICIWKTKKVSKLKITNFPEDKKVHFKNVKLYKPEESDKTLAFFINEDENGNTIEKFEVKNNI